MGTDFRARASFRRNRLKIGSVGSNARAVTRVNKSRPSAPVAQVERAMACFPLEKTLDDFASRQGLSLKTATLPAPEPRCRVARFHVNSAGRWPGRSGGHS